MHQKYERLRAVDVKYQIFVSSTFKDLEDERRSAIESILNLGHIPVGMELFQAGDDTQWNYIKRRIDECDYYVVIVAERYGSEFREKSYTQLEYEYAVKTKKPVAAFLLQSEARAAWPQDRVEFAKKAKVEAFRRLCEKKLVKHWRNADDLALKLATTLVELFRERPQIGWVRADNVPSTSVLQEISRLSEEKRELQRQLDAVREANPLAPPSDIAWRMKKLASMPACDYIQLKEGTLSGSLLDLLLSISRRLATPIAIWDVAYSVEEIHQVQLAGWEAIRPATSEYAAHALIETRTVQRQLGTQMSNELQLFLNEYGKKMVMFAELDRNPASS